MRRIGLPAILAGVVAWGASSTEAAEPPARAGHVLAATPKRAYLDAGAADGVKLGDELALSRRGRKRGTCKVDAVAEHRASCAGGGFAAGDAFALGAAPAPTAAAEPHPLPPPAESADVVRAHAVVTAARVPQVAFKGETRSVPDRALPAEVSLGHRAYLMFTGSGRSFQVERLGVLVDGAELGFGGIRGYVDAVATHFVARPDGARFENNLVSESTRLEVWQAALAAREPGVRSLMWGAGRLRPWNAPGLVSVDGGELGWVSHGGGLELGVLAGVLPDARTLAPRGRDWLANATLAGTLTGGRGSFFRFARAEARVGARDTEVYGVVNEAEALLLAALGEGTSLSAEARGALANGEPARLEAAGGDLTLRPTDSLRLEGGLRYSRDSLADTDLGGVTAVPWSGAFQSDWGVSYRFGPRLGLGVVGGWARDIDAAFARTWAGPEIDLPRLFGDRGGVRLSYLEELGWFSGRSGAGQVFLRAGERVRIGGRVSVFQDRLRDDADYLPPEVGLGANVLARLTSWLHVRATALSRFGIVVGEGGEGEEGGGSSPSLPAGLAASLDLVGTTL